MTLTRQNLIFILGRSRREVFPPYREVASAI